MWVRVGGCEVMVEDAEGEGSWLGAAGGNGIARRRSSAVMKCQGERGIMVSVLRRIGDAKRTLSSAARSQLKRMEAKASTEKVVALDGRIARGTR